MITFLITFIFGMFGVHKFLEGNKKMGVVYLLTLGLFSFGWIYDTVIAFKNMISPNKGGSSIKKYERPYYKFLFKYITNVDYKETMKKYGVNSIQDMFKLKKFFDWYMYGDDFSSFASSYSFTVYSQALGLKGKDKVGEYERVTNMLIKLGAIGRNIMPPYDIVNHFGIMFTRILPEADGSVINVLDEKPSLYTQYKSLSDGHDFEHFFAHLLKERGYLDVEVTQGSGDQGVDILAKHGDVNYAIQCKLYTGNVGNDAVQQIVAGKNHYGAQVGAVATNSNFTKSAIELAKSNGIILWNGNDIENMISEII